MKSKLLFVIVISSFMMVTFSYAQHDKCATMTHWERLKQNDPNVDLRNQVLEDFTQDWIQQNNTQKRTNNVIYIPVVVHVLYHAEIENISNEQIFSQIDRLNLDFRLLNSDSLTPDNPFWNYTADVEVEFCLAQQDPEGNPTSGITRTYTDTVAYSGIGYEKFSEYGGKGNWDPTQYLNIWVCNLGASNGTLGYASFPSDLQENPQLDGVVLRYEAMGTIGTAGTGDFTGNNLGRTATHEVGHWLNLRHIWGDENCGDDFVPDTQPAEDANYFCPTFPHKPNNQCGTGDAGEMYMNYMDYVDDNCMNMFTFGQKNRMLAAIAGARSGLLSSKGCQSPSGISDDSFSGTVNIFPNPSKGRIIIELNSNEQDEYTISIMNSQGIIVNESIIKKISSVQEFEIDLSDEAQGVYFLRLKSDNSSIIKKVVIHE